MVGPTVAMMRSADAPKASISWMTRSATRVQRAAPAAMRRADHAGFGVGEQYRRAISGQDRQHNAGRAGNQAVGLRRSARATGQLLLPRRSRGT